MSVEVDKAFQLAGDSQSGHFGPASDTNPRNRNNDVPPSNDMALIDVSELGLEGSTVNAIIEGKAADLEPSGEESDFPEGGRGWLVVLGCFIVAAVVLGWP
jgi:hypothetical protein